jgi:hypothetical protein
MTVRVGSCHVIDACVFERRQGDGSDSEFGTSDEDSEDDVATVKLGKEKEEDDDMEMQEYDRKLAMMLQMRQKAKLNAKALALEATHFRNRVLDLVEVAVSQLEGHPLLFDVVMPLLKCLRVCCVRIKQVC